MDDTLSGTPDHLVIHHSDGQEQKIPIPAVTAQPLRIGRETDNDIVVSDPRVSRHHAQIRRGPAGIEIKDTGSANGVIIDGRQIPADTWQPLRDDVMAYLGDTGISYEVGIDKATTISMRPVYSPPQTESPVQSSESGARTNTTPWLVVAGAFLIVVLIVVGAVLLLPNAGRKVTQPGATQTSQPLSQVTPGAPPTTAAEEGDEQPGEDLNRIPYPAVTIDKVEVKPILLGGLPDPSKANIILRVRIENHGTGYFTMSSDQFSLLDASGLVLNEVGTSLSSDGLRKLGLSDRYQNLRLGPGDSVAESLLFPGEAQDYDLFLRYEAPGLDPITLEIGKIDAATEVALALGTPVTRETAVASAVSTTPAVKPSATTTPTRPPAMPTPKTVSASTLAGRIAYPVFNGEGYDLYVGQADGSGTQFLMDSASQPQFSLDGTKLVFHSWRADQRGLSIVNADGSAPYVITGAPEDQLPTWAPDGSEIIFLSRRSGQRASELFRVSDQGGDPFLLGNAEYPTWSSTGQLVYKGWESTGIGLRISQPEDLTDAEVLTSDDTDTAPAVSPDGKRIAFMSKRDGNWNVYLVRSDGTNLERLTDDPAEDGLPTWSPDGKAIAFVSNRGGPWAIWAMTPEGSGRRQLFTMEGSPDGLVFGEDLDTSRGWAEERISWTR